MKLTLIQGDCLKVLPTIPDESVNLVLTDPPFNISRPFVLDRTKLKKLYRPSKLTYDFGEWDKWDYDKFTDFLWEWIEMCFNKLKDDGQFYTFCSKERMETIWKIWEALGGKPKNIITWVKPHCAPNMQKTWHSVTEFIFYGIKHKQKPLNFKSHKEIYNVIFCPNISAFKEENTIHPTQKPEKVVEHLMKVSSNENDTILDPFLGSGTTMDACLRLKRNCIGIEINPEYIEICKKRLNWGSSLGNIEFEFKDMSNVEISNNIGDKI